MTIAEVMDSLNTCEANAQGFVIEIDKLKSMTAVTVNEFGRLSKALSLSRIRDLP